MYRRTDFDEADQSVVDSHEQEFARPAQYDQPFPGMENFLDESTQNYYQDQLDRVSLIERAMANRLFTDAQYLVSEHTRAHYEASRRASEVRPYLAKRGLIED